MTTMKRHAILIMAHNEFDILEKSIRLHDDPRNDIYVHIDKKVVNFDPSRYHSLVNRAGLFFVDRIPVTWGSYSQINAEMLLLKAAAKHDYAFFHLISGSDLPIKSQDEMHDFFDKYNSFEFLREDENAYISKDFMVRIRYYFFFQELLGKKRSGLLNLINRASLKTQEVLGVDRTRHSGVDYRKGLNWFSITPKFAVFLLSREDEIRRNYRYTLAADEIFIYTIAWNSEFRGQVSRRMTRFTKSGKPYIFTIKDADALMISDAFWARKFSARVDAEIIERIYHETHP